MRTQLTSLGLCLLLLGCNANEIYLVYGPDQKIPVQVEIADTPEEQAKGLMGRTDLREGHGMLFIFEQEQPLSFWMKNTLIPLDILYFSAIGEFVSATTMTPCEADPCPSYPSTGPARYALELPAGFLEKNHPDNNWLLDLRNVP